jgi:hypothetical protein
MWWLLVTGLVVGALVGLSFLALDKPNVVWSAEPGSPALCPQCRNEVKWYAHRCPTCREEFDWVVSPEEDSPWCRSCLTSEEGRWLAARRKALGEAAAVAKVAAATGLTTDGAKAWLRSMGPGQCGWCGGTGREGATGSIGPCAVCFGESHCIVCDESLHVRRGNERAGREWERMAAHWSALSRSHAEVDLQALVRGDAQEFLKHGTGTEEATLLPFWPDVPHDLQRGPPTKDSPRAAARARARVVSVLTALE